VLLVVALLAAAACLSTAAHLRGAPSNLLTVHRQQHGPRVPEILYRWAQWQQQKLQQPIKARLVSDSQTQQQLESAPQQQQQQQQRKSSWFRRLLGTVKFPGPDDPTLKPYAALPKHFQLKWFEVFKQQWQDYHTGLQAVKIGDKSLADLAAPLLLQNVTMVNPAQLQRAIGHMGAMHRLRR
jgi:hypothetical protein